MKMGHFAFWSLYNVIVETTTIQFAAGTTDSFYDSSPGW